MRPAQTSVWPLYPPGSAPPEGLLPDIIVDERQLVHDRMHVCVNMPDGWQVMRVLRVGIATPNVGLGDLRLEGRNVADCDISNDVVEQIVSLDDSGSHERRRQLPQVSIEFHQAHLHFHLRDWASLRLVRPTPGVCENLRSRPRSCVVRESQKLSFCIRDSRVFDGAIGPQQGRYNLWCQLDADGVARMGIQRGWSDVYGRGLFGQVVNTSGLSGTYWLEAEVNPAGTVEEADPGNNVVRVPVTFSTPQACVLGSAGYACADPGVCTDHDCTRTTPSECCPRSNNPHCELCKDYFCLQDPTSVACLGPCGVDCEPTVECQSVPGMRCPTDTPTRTPTAPTPTPTLTRTPTPTGPTRTPTSTPPTPRLPDLAVLIPDVESDPGQRVPLDVYLAGGRRTVGGLQFDLLLPQAAVASLNLGETSSDCVLPAELTATHRLRAAHAPDRPVAGFDRVRVLVLDGNVTDTDYSPTDTLADGVVVRCWLPVLSNAQRGRYPLRIDRPRAGDVRGTPLWPMPGRSSLWVGGCTGSCC